MVGQILFLAIFSATVYILYRRIKWISGNIRMGKSLTINDQRKKRWKNVILIAFGQKKMFRRIVPAILHFLIYAGFIIINIEILEFIIDGLSGQHRSFALWLQNKDSSLVTYNQNYHVLMNLFEFLTVGVMVACIIFLIRRNILKLKRFSGIEMTRWPLLDANLILIFEIVLMLAILTMNGADQLLQARKVGDYIPTGSLFFSNHLILPLIEGMDTNSLILIERMAWWLHIIGIFGFAIYVTYSKHLHIIMAFPNTYFGSLNPPGVISNMEDVMNEVKIMLGIEQAGNDTPSEPGTFGVKDVRDLSWKNLMDAYTCTECGRCTSVCPANLTGKRLSPRKVIMDVRDRLEEMGKLHGQNDEKSLFSYIEKEELLACTTCNACTDICPVSIDPVAVIIGMRRYMAMEESSSPAAWNMMFNNIETNFAPWKLPASDRFRWMDDLQNNGSNGNRKQ